jgi:hypothetical protein
MLQLFRQKLDGEDSAKVAGYGVSRENVKIRLKFGDKNG